MVRPGGPRAALPSAAALLLGSLLLSWAGSLALPVVIPESQTQAKKTCILSGTWVNELGSRMTVSSPDGTGQISGSYLTAVTAASNEPIGPSRLQGIQHLPSQRGGQPTFGFLIKFKSANSESIAGFVGQCFVDASGQETLETSWLLRKEAATHADDWKSTLLGKNVFIRIK